MGTTDRAPWRLLERLRYQSHSGRLIARHRALHRLEFKRASVLHSVVLLAGSYGILLAGRFAIADFWAWELVGWLSRLDLPHSLGFRTRTVLGVVLYVVPYPEITGSTPSGPILRTSVIACGVLMLTAFGAMRGRLLPLAYLVWGACLVQLIATFTFSIAPAAFTHTVATHVATGLEFALVLILFVPVLLSFSYYVFEYSVAKKVVGTLVILAGLVMVAPLQYLAHVLLVHDCSLVIMPILYVLFGLLFDIAVFIALYAWVVSWEA